MVLLVIAGSIGILAVTVGILNAPRLLVQPLVIASDSEATVLLREKALAFVQEKLYADSLLLPGETQYLFRIEALEKQVREEFPSLKEVTIRKSIVGDWELFLMQRIPFGTLCNDEGCFLIDNEGVIVQKTILADIGFKIQSKDSFTIGTHIFGEVEHSTKAVSQKNFLKLTKVIQKLKELGETIKYIGVNGGSYDVFIALTNGVGIWVDMTESVGDITKALHAVFVEVFQEKEERKTINSIVICDPHNILWTKTAPWLQGCREE